MAGLRRAAGRRGGGDLGPRRRGRGGATTTGRTVIPAELDDAIARASQLGMAHQVPPLRALRLGLVSAAFVSRAASAIDLNRFGNRPAVVILQDDDFQASGPAGFPVARKALRWGRA